MTAAAICAASFAIGLRWRRSSTSPASEDERDAGEDPAELAAPLDRADREREAIPADEAGEDADARRTSVSAVVPALVRRDATRRAPSRRAEEEPENRDGDEGNAAIATIASTARKGSRAPCRPRLLAMSVYADVIRYRELFGSLFRRDIRAKYRGSFLGLGWSLLHPLVLMLVYLLVFSVLWRVAEVGSDDYWLFLLCGLPAWVFFATAAQAASRSLLENANLIRKVRFPRQLVPLSIVGTNLVSFAVMLGGRRRAEPRGTVPEARATVWLAFPLGGLFACIVAGFALAVASLNAALPRRRAPPAGAPPARGSS